MASNLLEFDQVRSVAIASITGSYKKLGGPFTFPMRLLHFINDTNGTYMLSNDGVTDKIPLIGVGFNLYDGTSDEDSNEMARFHNGMQWWIKYLVAPTSVATMSNAVYLACMYGKGE